jgi:hypothetical protein
MRILVLAAIAIALAEPSFAQAPTSAWQNNYQQPARTWKRNNYQAWSEQRARRPVPASQWAIGRYQPPKSAYRMGNLPDQAIGGAGATPGPGGGNTSVTTGQQAFGSNGNPNLPAPNLSGTGPSTAGGGAAGGGGDGGGGGGGMR